MHKVNVVISLRSGTKVDTHVDEQQENELPSPSSSSLPPPCVDVNPTTIDAHLLKGVDNFEGDESVDDFMPPKGTPTPSSCASTPSSVFQSVEG